DACGRRKTASFDVEEEDNDTDFNGVAYGDRYRFGVIVISHNNELASITITQAPTCYPNALPYNVRGVSSNTREIEDIPIGDNTFDITDECGNSYTVETTINPYPYQGIFQVANAPGCSGYGSVRLTSTSGNQPI